MDETQDRINAAHDEFVEVADLAALKVWWEKFYRTLGHRRLGKILLGRTVD